jgi:hypothetical protein
MPNRDWLRWIPFVSLSIASLTFSVAAVFGLMFWVLGMSSGIHQEWEDRHEYEKSQTQEASKAIREHCSIADTPPSRVAHCLEQEIVGLE